VQLAGGSQDFLQRVDALPHPAPHVWTGPYDLLVTGVGGTGVVTVGALVAMAAHLEGKSASVLDFMGFAQKGGSVLSFVRFADLPARLNQVRIDTQQADAILACDLVVGRLARPRSRPCAMAARASSPTRHEVHVAESLRNPDASLKVPALLEKLRFAAGADRVETLDAQALAEAFLGDTIYSNIVALGFGLAARLVPVSLQALLRAIELNGVAVDNNKLAFSLGGWRPPMPRPSGAAARRRLAAPAPRRWTRSSRAASRTSPATRTPPMRALSRFVATVREREQRWRRRRAALHARRRAVAC
jgi:indolepyruvate ferredoxin oxidoreductase